MSIRLIYGRAGTGKSEICLKEIKEKLEENLAQKIYVIVPEQFSYATEKRLLEILDSKSTVNAEVITFKRMAYRVFSEVGGITQANLSEIGKAMLVSYILEKNKSKLNFLGKTCEIDLILRTITELKKHNINVLTLEEKTKEIDNEYLKLKLEDVNQIYKEYQSAIEKNYIDEEDALTILADKLRCSKMFENSLVYIDEFSGFTEQEYLIIKEIFKKATDTNIIICSNNLKKNKNPETDIFYTNKQVIEKLMQICKDEKLEIKEKIELSNSHRFKNEELKFLEENIYTINCKIYNKPIENIHLKLCSNPYSEIEEVAKTIIKLVQKENMRFRDISILTKNIEEYTGIIKAIFPKYDIPIFIDSNKELSENILVKYVLAIFDVYAKNWSYNSVISYVKTGFTNISKQDIYKLEKYCKKWGIKGNKWYKEDWTYDSTNIDIENINNLRKAVVQPLINFSKRLETKKTAGDITRELYRFLQDNTIREKLEEKIKKLQQTEEVKYANEYAASWNTLIAILDEINLVFENQKMSFESYRGILKAGLELGVIGQIPQSIDQVIIGDVERSRNHKVRALFILGLNDGVFPSTNNQEGFLNDNDRNILKQKGIELAKGTIESLYEDQFNIYKAFSTSEEKIYLSYLSSDKDGKAKRASVLITKIKKIFSKLIEQSDIIEKNTSISIPKATFGELLSNIREVKNGEQVDDVWKSVYNWYLKNDEWKEKLQNAIKGFEKKNNPEKITKSNIQRLYGNVLRTSVSRLEQYRKCPFSFHLKYGLKLKEKEELKIKPIDTGSFMHDIIDTFFDNIKNVKNIKEEEIEEKVIQIINEKLSLSKNYIFISNPKFIVLTNRLKKVVLQSIKYIVFQIQDSDFDILGNEVEFKKVIDNVEITGKIDRIDVAESEQGKYIRIIDYKSSEKNIDLNELISGTGIQLITYIDWAVSNEKEQIPAGMLYYNLIDPILKSNKNKTDEEIKEEIKKQFRMNGMVIADINIIKMMDKTLQKGSSSNIPVYLDKDGNISNSRSNTITKEQFTNMQKTANKVIKQIAKEILEGNIDIKPAYYKKSKIDTCKYCEYKSICRFDPNINKYLFIGNKAKEEMLEVIKEVK